MMSTARKRITLQKENVEPAKNDALFWHAVWISAGHPATGALHQVMAWARNKYHYDVRKAKRLAESIRSRYLLEAEEQDDLALRAETKKTLMKKTVGQAVPESLEK